MGTAAISLIAFFLVLGAAFTAIGDALGIPGRSAETQRAAWNQALRLVDTDVQALSADPTSTLLVTDVDVLIENTGRTKFASSDFPEWEVVVRYQDTLGSERFEYITYAEAVSAGNWTVEQIYLDESTSTAEAYEPGIFNPNEQMVINVRLFRVLGINTTNSVTISTPEGDRSSVLFNG